MDKHHQCYARVINRVKLPDEFKDKQIEDLRFLDENYVLAELQEYDQKFNRDIIMYYIF